MTVESQSRESRLLGILQEHAPNSDAQQKCTELVQRMQRDQMPGFKIEEALAGALLDGLRNGNWPWIAVHDVRVRGGAL